MPAINIQGRSSRNDSPLNPLNLQPDNFDWQVVTNKRWARSFRFRTYAKTLRERYSGNTAQVSIEYGVAWLDRWMFCLHLLGYAEILEDPGSQKKYISRQLPQGYYGTIFTIDPGGDKDPHPTWLWANHIENMVGMGPLGYDNNGAPLYKEARITVIYESISYRLATDAQLIKGDSTLPGYPEIPDEAKKLGRYITRFVQPSADYFALPHGRFYWATGSAPFLHAPVTGAQLGFVIPYQEVVYIWHQVPRVKKLNDIAPPAYAVPSVIKTALGSVNKTAFDNGRFEPGTLLLTSVEIKPYRWIGGNYYADITYKMKYLNAVKPFANPPENYNPARGHNYFLQMPVSPSSDPNTGDGFTDFEHHLLTHNGQETGIKVYRETDFHDLFRPDQT